MEFLLWFSFSVPRIFPPAAASIDIHTGVEQAACFFFFFFLAPHQYLAELDPLLTSASSFFFCINLSSFLIPPHLPPDLRIYLLFVFSPRCSPTSSRHVRLSFLYTPSPHTHTSPSPRNLPLPFALKSPTSRAPHLPTSCAPLPRPLHLPTSCALLPRPLLVPLKSLSSFLPKWLRRRPRGTNTI